MSAYTQGQIVSLPEQVRQVLRSAPGPMTAREVRESLAGDYSAERVGAALHAMAKSGEAIQERSPGLKHTYLLDPTWKPTKHQIAATRHKARPVDPQPSGAPENVQQAIAALRDAPATSMIGSHVSLPRHVADGIVRVLERCTAPASDTKARRIMIEVTVHGADQAPG